MLGPLGGVVRFARQARSIRAASIASRDRQRGFPARVGGVKASLAGRRVAVIASEGDLRRGRTCGTEGSEHTLRGSLVVDGHGCDGPRARPMGATGHGWVHVRRVVAAAPRRSPRACGGTRRWCGCRRTVRGHSSLPVRVRRVTAKLESGPPLLDVGRAGTVRRQGTGQPSRRESRHQAGLTRRPGGRWPRGQPRMSRIMPGRASD